MNRIPPTKVLIVEVLGAIMFGSVAAVVATLLAQYILIGPTFTGTSPGMEVLGSLFVSGLFGFAIGASGGVATFGNLLTQNGSVWFALIGSILAFGLGFLLVSVQNSGLNFLVWIGLEIMGAVVGYNLRSPNR